MMDVKMHDMGEMIDMPTMAGEKSKKEKEYPHTEICSSEIPEAADYNVGDMIEVHSINRVIEKREKDDGEIEIRLETIKCGIAKSAPMSQQEYANLTDEGKDKVDEEEVMSEE